ncbi:flagellar assembly protein FliW [Kineococcus sp. NUM-3379]
MTDTDVAAPQIEFIAPITGLNSHTRFELHPLDEEGNLFSLRSMDDPNLRLVVMAPDRFFPGYSPEIDDETADALELTKGEDAAVLLVVNPGESLEDATANLLAPVVINHRSHKAAQAILTERDLPLRAMLIRDRD